MFPPPNLTLPAPRESNVNGRVRQAGCHEVEERRKEVLELNAGMVFAHLGFVAVLAN